MTKAFIVHGTRSGDKKFIRSNGGLHYFDASANNERFVMMQTFRDNKSKFTKKDIKSANEAIKLYHTIG